MHWHLNYRNSNKLCCLSILIVFGVSNIAFAMDDVLQCDYADSVNITAGTLQPNKSYTYNGIEYPEGHYARIAYIIFDQKIIPKTPYIRGCVCNVQKCLRFCCPYGKYLEIKNGVGRCHFHDAAKHIEGEIINHNNETKRIKYHDHFAILHTYPCKSLDMPGEQYSITHVSVLWHRTIATKRISNFYSMEKDQYFLGGQSGNRKSNIPSTGILFDGKL